MRSLISTISFILVLSGSVDAQAAPSPGDRVRVVLTDGERVTGTVDASANGQLSLAADRGATRVIGMSEIGTLELSAGKHRRFAKYFGISVGGAAAIGGTLSAVTWSPCTETGLFACMLHPESRGDALFMGLVGGAILGLPIGLIVGLANKEERWQRVELKAPNEAVLSIRPVVGPAVGTGFAASITVGRR